MDKTENKINQKGEGKMNNRFCFKKKFISKSRWGVFHGTIIAAMIVLLACPCMAINFTLGGKQATLMGYVNQGISLGIAGKEYDTRQDFQSALFQALFELQLDLSHDLKFFSSVGINADWAYPILTEDSEWKDKQFDHSRDELLIFGDRRDILHEFHLTWTPGNWYFRVGKQIVVWGETDGFRLMDQINPLDQRRGMTDVEFETTILPIWLVRAEYYLQPNSSWLQDLGFEFIFNPNPDFRGDEAIMPGNDKSGIWAPKIKIPMGDDYAHLGSFDLHLHKPGHFDDDGFEYAFRIKSVINDTIITLNYFYGRDNLPVIKSCPSLPRMETSPYDGRTILHPAMKGYYPLMRFVGATLTRDFEHLYLSKLGGVAPVLRLEALYAFNNTFTTLENTFDQYDEVRYAIGIDWKVWIRTLNPRAAFMISPQFYHRKIMNYPSHGLENLRDDNYQASLMINTTYFHNKIEPMFFWLRDISQKANFFKMQVKYERSDVWNYTLGVLLLNGAKTGQGFEPLTNKDQVYFTVGYRF